MNDSVSGVLLQKQKTDYIPLWNVMLLRQADPKQTTLTAYYTTTVKCHRQQNR